MKRWDFISLVLAVISADIGLASGTGDDAGGERPVLMRFTDLRSQVRNLDVIRSRREFEKLSGPDMLAGAPPVPEGVDWRRHMLLLAASGLRTHSAYRIRIERVTETDASLWVHVKETEPAAGAAGARVLTYPTDVVAVARSEKPVRFLVNGRLERVVKPHQATSRPAVSLVPRDPVLSRFGLAGAALDRIEAAYLVFLRTRQSITEWYAAERKAGRNPAQEYAKRRRANGLAFEGVVRDVLGEERYAVHKRGRAIEADWKRRRAPLRRLYRSATTTEAEKRAAREQILALDRTFDADLDRLFSRLATTKPAAAPKPGR